PRFPIAPGQRQHRRRRHYRGLRGRLGHGENKRHGTRARSWPRLHGGGANERHHGRRFTDGAVANRYGHYYGVAVLDRLLRVFLESDGPDHFLIVWHHLYDILVATGYLDGQQPHRDPLWQ